MQAFFEKDQKFINQNVQKRLDAMLEDLSASGKVPRLLLHACCAPCSSYVLEYLSTYFSITVFYFNPNIAPEEEYRKRVKELSRFIAELPVKYPVSLLEGEYEPERFYDEVRGLEKEAEGGKRCEKCFRLRLFETARLAKEGNFDYFTTTLTISPLKNANLLNRIGEEAAEAYKTVFIPSDFKKKGGYQRSIELSREYQLYRQNFCGCIYSQQTRSEKDKEVTQ